MHRHHPRYQQLVTDFATCGVSRQVFSSQRRAPLCATRTTSSPRGHHPPGFHSIDLNCIEFELNSIKFELTGGGRRGERPRCHPGKRRTASRGAPWDAPTTTPSCPRGCAPPQSIYIQLNSIQIELNSIPLKSTEEVAPRKEGVHRAGHHGVHF